MRKALLIRYGKKDVQCSWNRREVYQSQFKSFWCYVLHFFSLNYLKRLFKNLLATDQLKLCDDTRKWPVNRSKLPVIFSMVELQQGLFLLKWKSYTQCNSHQTYCLHKFYFPPTMHLVLPLCQPFHHVCTYVRTINFTVNVSPSGNFAIGNAQHSSKATTSISLMTWI